MTMKRFLILILAMGVVLGAADSLLAQEKAPMGPPKVLQIFREEVKYGRGSAHEKNEAAYVAAFKRAKWPTTYLAIASATGPGEAWFLTGYDSFEAWEKDSKAAEKATALQAELTQLGEKDAEYVSNGRSIVAVYRPDLSYHPGINVGTYRYFEVETVRVRLGFGNTFTEMEKLAVAAHEKANIDEHWACFEVAEGMPAGTFLFFTPMKSLKEADSDHGQAVRAAMGEEAVARRRQFAREGIALADSNIFAFSPKMSYAPKAWVDADPDFWAPKPKAAAKAAAAEGEAKPAAPAKKEAAKAPKKQQ
jgi:hypothetical protein